MTKMNYKKKPNGELDGSYPSPVSPAPAPEAIPASLIYASTPSTDSTFDYARMHSVLAERSTNQELTEKERKQEELREEVHRFASNVPVGEAALESYFEMVAKDLDTNSDDVRLRYETLRAIHDTEAAPAPPDWEKVRFVMPNPDGRGFIGTPIDNASIRALAHLESLAADKRREGRSRVEEVDEDGVRWVKYSNERLSEVLRGVVYDETSGNLKVWLAAKGAAPVMYSYQNVHPSLIRQLVSARSMGRFYAYTFSPESPDASFADRTVNNYSFAAHIANGLLPAGGVSTGRVPSRSVLAKLRLFPSNN